MKSLKHSLYPTSEEDGREQYIRISGHKKEEYVITSNKPEKIREVVEKSIYYGIE